MVTANRLNRGMWVRPMASATEPVRAPYVQVDFTRPTQRTLRSGHTEPAVFVQFTDGTHMVVHPYSEWDVDMAASA